MNAIQDTVMTADIARKVLSVVDRGLCGDLGEPIPGQMCVDPALRSFVITLKDSPWSSPMARATGMRKLAVAQLGSLGKFDSIMFVQKLAEQTIRRLLPPILRQVGLNDAADRCEQEGTQEAANAARLAAAAFAAGAAATNATAAKAAGHAGDAAFAARHAARDGVLMLMSDICIDILRDMGAPGIALMDQVC